VASLFAWSFLSALMARHGMRAVKLPGEEDKSDEG